MNDQQKYRVALIGAQILLSEGLQLLLRQMEDVELAGPWELKPDVLERIATSEPDVVLIADKELHCEAAKVLTTQLIEQFPSLPVIRVDLSRDVLRVYTMHTSPARRAVLVEVIRNLPSTLQ